MDNTSNRGRTPSGTFAKRPQQSDDEGLPTEVLMAAASLPQSGAATGETDNLVRELLLDELSQRRKKRQQDEDELRRLLQARTEGFKAEQERRELGQAICNHRKENQRPNIGGQRLSNGHTAFVCGTCFKVWMDNLPPNLQVSLEHIGG